MIPSLRPHALHPGIIQGKEGIKICHLATLGREEAAFTQPLTGTYALYCTYKPGVDAEEDFLVDEGHLFGNVQGREGVNRLLASDLKCTSKFGLVQETVDKRQTSDKITPHEASILLLVPTSPHFIPLSHNLCKYACDVNVERETSRFSPIQRSAKVFFLRCLTRLWAQGASHAT